MKSQQFGFVQRYDLQSPFYNDPAFTMTEQAPKLLIADLTSLQIELKPLPEGFAAAYVGGRALALRLFAEYAEGQVAKNNPIVISGAFLNGTGTPFSDNLTFCFQSPVTGSVAVYSVPLSYAAKLKNLGICCVVITGVSDSSRILNISGDSFFETAAGLAGLDSALKIDDFLKLGNPQLSVIATGRAADNLLPLSCPVSEGKTIGRAGLGLLFAEKGLKAITIEGDDTPYTEDDSESRPYKAKLKALLVKSKAVNLKNTETALGRKATAYGFAPVQNFRYRTDHRWFYLCSKSEALVSHHTCSSNTQLLLHNERELPYSVLAMLGSDLGIFDTGKIAEMYDRCIQYGLDPVSTGNLLGWARDMYAGGFFREYPELGFSSSKELVASIDEIALGSARLLFRCISQGAKAVNEKIVRDGMREVLAINGLECGPFDYRGFESQALEDAYLTGMVNLSQLFLPLTDEKPKKLGIFTERNDALAEGIESAGFDYRILTPVLYENETMLGYCSYFFPKLLEKNNPVLLNRCFTEATSCDLKPDAFAAVGRISRNLRFAINKALGSPEPEIPQYFLSNPESNAQDDKTVPFTKIKNAYLSCCLKH